MIKRLFSVVVFLLLFLIAGQSVEAQEEAVNIHFFWNITCPHCKREKTFLEDLARRDGEVRVYGYELTMSSKNRSLAREISKTLDVDISAVPFTVIGETFFTGYLDDKTTGAYIEELVAKAKEEGYNDVVGKLAGFYPEPSPKPTEVENPDSNPGTESTESAVEETEESKEQVILDDPTIPKTLSLPIVGEIETKNLSLPMFTFVVALLDGFNPCAMWVLLFLIARLLVMKNAKRRWTIGITFILASGLVYFLFLSAWLNLFLFLGFITWVRVIIGILALGSGGYYLYDFWKNKDGGCQVVDEKKRKGIFQRIDEVTHKKQFLAMLLGIIVLAFLVNLIELLCSAGLPAVYTHVLSLTEMSTFTYYMYLIFYILIFLIDDMAVFSAAMLTMQAVGVQSKYARFSHLVGGFIMLGIGLALLFKPELLTFGG